MINNWCFLYQFRPDFEACLFLGGVGGREGKEGGLRGGGHGSIMAGSRSWEIYYYSGWLHQPYRIMQWPRLESAPCRAAGIALLYGVFLVKKSSSLWIRARRLRRHTLVGNCQKCFPNLIFKITCILSQITFRSNVLHHHFYLPEWPKSTWQPSSIHFRHGTNHLRLHGHFGPVYLL